MHDLPPIFPSSPALPLEDGDVVAKVSTTTGADVHGATGAGVEGVVGAGVYGVAGAGVIDVTAVVGASVATGVGTDDVVTDEADDKASVLLQQLVMT